MEADEEIRVMFLGKRDPAGIGDVGVTGARQKDLPALLFEQGRQPFRPVERELLLEPPVQDAVGADVGAAVTRINDNGRPGLRHRQRRLTEQRFQIFLQVAALHENLAVNNLRLKAEMDFSSVPGRFAAADGQDHHAIGRTNRIAGDRRI